jgi:hypothetical protein
VFVEFRVLRCLDPRVKPEDDGFFLGPGFESRMTVKS